MVSRAERGLFAEWWRTVDRVMLGALFVLMIAGVLLSLAGSPAVAERLGYDSFHFVQRHLFFIVPTIAVLLAVSFLSPRMARRLAMVVLIASLALMLATLFVGEEVKGARRWIAIAGFTIQPSEFMKPAFVVVAAWLFAERRNRPDVPANAFAFILLLIVGSLLIAQPDFGQTLLVVLAWGAVFFVAGMSWLWIAIGGGLALTGIVGAYVMLPHVANRIDRFLSPETGDTFQVDKALGSIMRGGWFGQGPGEGIVKRVLPDAHTDFIFAVAAEEFGILACIVLVMVFGVVVLRGLSSSARAGDPFIRLASAGLVTLFGVQAVINMSVNLNLIPAKGMTLPFVSYGGSSMIAIAFGMGLLLAFTRRSAAPGRLRQPLVSPAAVPAT